MWIAKDSGHWAQRLRMPLFGATGNPGGLSTPPLASHSHVKGLRVERGWLCSPGFEENLPHTDWIFTAVLKPAIHRAAQLPQKNFRRVQRGFFQVQNRGLARFLPSHWRPQCPGVTWRQWHHTFRCGVT